MVEANDGLLEYEAAERGAVEELTMQPEVDATGEGGASDKIRTTMEEMEVG